MKVIWAMLCENFAQDKNTNMVSVFNIIDEIRVFGAPPVSEPWETAQMVSYQFKLLALFARSFVDVQEHGRTRVRVADPDGIIVEISEGVEVNLLDFDTYRVWFNYPGLPVSSAGTYRFLLDCKADDGDWEEQFEVPIQVKLGPVPNI